MYVPLLSETEIEIYAQAGGTVTIQRDTYRGTVVDSSDGSRKVYVNWYRGSEISALISRNPQSGIQGGYTIFLKRFFPFFTYATIMSILIQSIFLYLAAKEKTRVSMLPDFSLQISPVEESDFGAIRCEQHVLTEVYNKHYRLRRGKTKTRDVENNRLLNTFILIRFSLDDENKT